MRGIIYMEVDSETEVDGEVSTEVKEDKEVLLLELELVVVVELV